MEDTKERREDSREKRRKLGHLLCSIIDWMSVDDYRPVNVLKWIVFVWVGTHAFFEASEGEFQQLVGKKHDLVL